MHPLCVTSDRFFAHVSGTNLQNVQENGGRKDRNILMDGSPPQMDMRKVIDWVKHGKLQNNVVNTAPKGQDQLRAAYYARENGNYPATPSENKYVGKIHVARYVPFPASFF